MGNRLYVHEVSSIKPSWWNGRHDGLKIRYSDRCVGSNPSLGTKNTNPGLIPWIFFYSFTRFHLSLIPSSCSRRLDLRLAVGSAGIYATGKVISCNSPLSRLYPLHSIRDDWLCSGWGLRAKTTGIKVAMRQTGYTTW